MNLLLNLLVSLVSAASHKTPCRAPNRSDASVLSQSSTMRLLLAFLSVPVWLFWSAGLNMLHSHYTPLAVFTQTHPHAVVSLLFIVARHFLPRLSSPTRALNACCSSQQTRGAWAPVCCHRSVVRWSDKQHCYCRPLPRPLQMVS